MVKAVALVGVALVAMALVEVALMAVAVALVPPTPWAPPDVVQAPR